MSDIYESGKILDEYLLFHFGSADEILPLGFPWPEEMRQALDFPVRTVRRFSKGNVERGLDLGCAVGRSSFEMARSCAEVIGIDFSHRFVAAAEALRRGEALDYRRLEEAAITTPMQARMPVGTDSSRLRFIQGDAMNLPAELGRFDRVHAANLLCRLAEPRRLLCRLPELVKPGGELVLATPCTWLGEFTPPENWPERGTMPWLTEHLGEHFEQTWQGNEPFLIRETARKFQWTASLVTVWRRLG